MISVYGSGANPLQDSVLALFDNTSARSYFDDDGGAGTNSLLTFTASVYRPVYHRRRSLSGLRPDRPIYAGCDPAAADRRGRFDVRQRRPDQSGRQLRLHRFRDPGRLRLRRRDRHLQDPDDGRQVLLDRGRRRRRLRFRLYRAAGGRARPRASSSTMPTGTRWRSTTTSASPATSARASASSPRRAALIIWTCNPTPPGPAAIRSPLQEFDPSDFNPLDAINWFSADNIDIGPDNTVKIYFATCRREL